MDITPTQNGHGSSLPWNDFYRERRVLVTGHTGFKGSWLSEWLLMLGAEVTGFSLEPEGEPSLFNQLGLENRMDHRIGDIRDGAALSRVLNETSPDVVFHLAAQPLVRQSYADPAGTYEVNFLGTVRLLDALRTAGRPCAAVIVTSDKCYENTGAFRGYQEHDRLGGYDSYSSSKACAELAVSSYRRSFFGVRNGKMSPVRVATARAGNVIGGGDWAPDRIVPDCVRSLVAGEPIPVRNKYSVRPWQHVLEPLGGYMLLAARIHHEADDVLSGLHQEFDTFNFGPAPAHERTVQELVEELLFYWPGNWVDHSPDFSPHEASVLTLDITKAARLLGWHPQWGFGQTVKQTIAWYRAATDKDDATMPDFTRGQIERYMRDLVHPATAPRAPAPPARLDFLKLA